MELQLKNNLIRVVILSVDGIYSQIYDEIYCDQDKYNKILAEFGGSDKYTVINIYPTYIQILFIDRKQPYKNAGLFCVYKIITYKNIS